MNVACPNCGALITCNCQNRTTSDNKQACSNCIEEYEKQKQLKQHNDNMLNTYLNS